MSKRDWIVGFSGALIGIVVLLAWAGKTTTGSVAAVAFLDAANPNWNTGNT